MSKQACPVCNNVWCPGPDGVAQDPNLCRICHLLGATDGICAGCEAAVDAVNEVWKDRTDPVHQLQGERVCFREWRVGEDLGLYSTGVGERWEQEMVADSSRCAGYANSFGPEPETHDAHEHAPDPNCSGCGLHAFYEVPEVFNYAEATNGLVGAVVVSGRTMLGPTGVRAEKARVVLLAYANDRQKVLADAASRKLGVGCCALADLERLALEYGQPVPDEEKPESEGFAAGGMVPPPGTWHIGPPIHLPSNVLIVGNNVHGATSWIATDVSDRLEAPKQKVRTPDYYWTWLCGAHFLGQLLIGLLWTHSLVQVISASAFAVLAVISACWTAVRKRRAS